MAVAMAAPRNRGQAQGWRRGESLCHCVDRQKGWIRPRTKSLLYRSLRVESVRQWEEGEDERQDRWGHRA